MSIIIIKHLCGYITRLKEERLGDGLKEERLGDESMYFPSNVPVFTCRAAARSREGFGSSFLEEDDFTFGHCTRVI